MKLKNFSELLQRLEVKKLKNYGIVKIYVKTYSIKFNFKDLFLNKNMFVTKCSLFS